MGKGLIIEGVAGTGKSTLIQKMKDDPRFKADGSTAIFVSENETLGELMAELTDKSVSHEFYTHRLKSVITYLNIKKSDFVVLERFHHSYYALGIDWNLLTEIDKTLAALSFKTVLLDLDDSLFASRCIQRHEREDQFWEESFISHFGSRENAITAFKESQVKRHEILKKSEIPSMVVNTSEMKWDQCLEKIVEFGLGSC